MTVSIGVLINAKEAENAQTTQFTATTQVIIDKFTATNTGAATPELSVNIVPSSGSAGNSNLIEVKTLALGDTYTFPAIVGQVMNIGDFISTISDTATDITIRCSGRVVT